MPTLQQGADSANRNRERRTLADFMNGHTPWWVKAIATIGLPSVFAAYLLWFVTVEMRADVNALIHISQQTCLNTADTFEERGGCTP